MTNTIFHDKSMLFLVLIVAFFVGASATDAFIDNSFAAKGDNNGNNGCENANPNAKACENNPNTTQNTPPSIGSVSIINHNNIDVTGTISGSSGPHLCIANDPMDAEGDNIEFTYLWTNSIGDVLGIDEILPFAVPGLVTCEVTPSDGTDSGAPVSASTTILCPPFCQR